MSMDSFAKVSVLWVWISYFVVVVWISYSMNNYSFHGENQNETIVVMCPSFLFLPIHHTTKRMFSLLRFQLKSKQPPISRCKEKVIISRSNFRGRNPPENIFSPFTLWISNGNHNNIFSLRTTRSRRKCQLGPWLAICPPNHGQPPGFQEKRGNRLHVRMNRNSWWTNYHRRNASRNPTMNRSS